MNLMTDPKKLARKILPRKTIKTVEKTYRKGRGVFWQAIYGFPTEGMKVIAVTGTNGKTTTVSYINAMLQNAGLRTAAYTTAYIEMAGKREPNKTHMTVSSERVVQKFFAEARAAGVDWVVMETTSHALDQERGRGVAVEVAVITNLTQEHLDYHKTMENYAAAKARLLKPPYKPRSCVLNADDQWFGYFRQRAGRRVIAYGEGPEANLKLKSYALSPQGSSLTASYQGETLKFTSQLTGKFNAYNALAACGVGLAIGLDKDQIEEGVAALESVPGRMERIDAGQPFSVIVDYAITPDALENVLGALREVTKGKLSIVFGATGDRDKTKRAPMGEVVGRMADRVFLTDDETYTENPASIREQVYEGIKKAGADSKTTVVEDRREAIRQAFQAAKPGDTVLLTGIGHQDYRNMGGRKEPWDEREVAREELSKLTK
jgi:UDP-N-acetylmuramoyl-L-alanyl-D-glutamate--2,6-diaminopimelate ligase